VLTSRTILPPSTSKNWSVLNTLTLDVGPTIKGYGVVEIFALAFVLIILGALLGTWCSSAKCENISCLIHLLRGLTHVTYTINKSHPCHSIISLTCNNTTRMLRKYITRASRSNTGTIKSDRDSAAVALGWCQIVMLSMIVVRGVRA
jgi:hypothetical protein